MSELINHRQIQDDACKVLLAYAETDEHTVMSMDLPYGDLSISLDDTPVYCHKAFSDHPYVDSSGLSVWFIDQPADPEDAKTMNTQLLVVKRQLLQTSRSIVRIATTEPRAVWTSFRGDDINPESMIGANAAPTILETGDYVTASFSTTAEWIFDEATNIELLSSVQAGLRACAAHL